ncbi:MAG: SpoIID/LytB domain-containing protein [Gemmatimonadota bacterium]
MRRATILLAAIFTAAPSGPFGAWPMGSEPVVRVGIEVSVPSTTLSSAAGLVMTDLLTGAEIGRVPAGESLVLAARVDRIVATSPAALRFPPTLRRVQVESAESGRPLQIGETSYRGSAEVVVHSASTVTAINRLPLEDYLRGVVPIEIGTRTPEEFAAVQAQTVAARTYALAHLGAREELGFDLFGSVQDQAYGGWSAEREDGNRAVETTRGEVLVYERRPIRAFYHSTCGGRTAPVEEVMDRPGAPYLISVSDTAPDGSDYCAISPRYRWEAEWTRSELNQRVRPQLAAYFGMETSEMPEIDRLEVRSRTRSGRVQALAFVGPGLDAELTRLDIRLALRDAADRILNSTDFEVADGDDPERIRLHGRGYGHGAGMCQFGALGRARAGQGYSEILGAYYVGAELVRAY